MRFRINNWFILFSALLALCVLFQGCKNKQKQYLPILGLRTVDSVTRDTIYHTTDNFSATDQMGVAISQDTLANKIYVANFFFVTCPGICKQMNNELERVQKAFAGNSRIKFASFTVDPEDDTLAALATYAKLHDAIPYQWYFLRTDKDTVVKLAKRSYLLEVQNYLIHSPNLTLVDSKKHIRGVYSGVIPAEVDRLIKDIKLLLKEENENGVPAKN